MYLLVGLSFCGIICLGLPITIELSGTSKFINAPGAIKTLFPIFTFPIIIEFAFIQTLSPIIGVPWRLPEAFPINVPCEMLKFLPIIVSGLTTMVPKWTMRKPGAIFVCAGICIPNLKLHNFNNIVQKALESIFFAT